jgi:hypothetical protein
VLALPCVALPCVLCLDLLCLAVPYIHSLPCLALPCFALLALPWLAFFCCWQSVCFQNVAVILFSKCCCKVAPQRHS